MTDEELIEAFDVADNWARPALLFALREGLLKGKGEEGLCPTDFTTRAEVVTVLTRVLLTQTKADLSAFRDVPAGAWYHDPIALAKAMGIINGTDEHTMAPNARITREQVFVMLARAFGVNGNDWEPIYNYSDWNRGSAWATPRLAAMIAAGKVKGGDGKLNPTGFITRQELAQVFYNLIRGKGETLPDPIPGSFALSAEQVPAGTVVDGDLIVCGEGDKLELEDLTVTGRLVIQGNGPVELVLKNCSIADLVLCRPATVKAHKAPELIEVHNAVTLASGSPDKVKIYEGSLTVDKGVTIKQADLISDNAVLTNNGYVVRAGVYAHPATVQGSGWIDTVVLGRTGAKVSCGFERMDQTSVTGIRGVTAEKTVDNKPTVKQPTIPVSIRLNNTPNDKRHCTLTWYLEGKKVAGPYLLTLYDGYATQCDINFKSLLRDDIDDTNATVKAVLNWQGEEKSFTFNYVVDDGIIQGAKAVRSQNVQAWTIKRTALYSWSDLSGYKTTLEPYTYVTYLTYYGTTSAYVRLSNGVTGWVHYWDIHISGDKFYVTWDYSRQVKEYFVNHVKSMGSNTKYLIWVSPYTQRVNVFQGSRGNWKLIRSFVCATGTNDHVTKVQDTTIQYKAATWDFAEFYVDKVSVIDGAGRAFHSRPKYYNSGAVYSWTMSEPTSHGCIRMLDEGCQFIYYNVPTGTRVIVY